MPSFLSQPNVVDFRSSGGSGRPGNLPKKWGVAPHVFGKDSRAPGATRPEIDTIRSAKTNGFDSPGRPSPISGGLSGRREGPDTPPKPWGRRPLDVWTAYLKGVSPERLGSFLCRFSATPGFKDPLNRRGSSFIARLHQQSTKRPFLELLRDAKHTGKTGFSQTYALRS